MTVSAEGLALVKRHEGFRAQALELADGRVAVGYSHVQAEAPAAPLSERDADKLLREDMAEVAAVIAARVLVPLSQRQFDALASFVFSIGADAFVKSDVLRRLNAGEPIAAACAMDAWRKSRVNGEPQVLDALVRRRAAERALFLELDAPAPASSPYVRPEIDHAASILGAAKVAAMPGAQGATRVAAPAPEPEALAADEEARRLADILARDPATAHALKAPPPPEFEEDEEPLLLDRIAPAAANTPRDVTRLALFGTGGAVLLATGLAALSQGKPVWFLLFAAPGAVIALAAGWQLLRERFGARWPASPLQE
jgi:lysozyme